MTRTIRVALALAGALTALACAARPAQPRSEGAAEGGRRAAGFSGGLIATPIGLVMTDFDADKDRATTRAELDAGADAAWPALDRDGNGEASALEFADWARAVMGSDTAIPGRMAFDSNSDGRVSRAEFVAGMSLEFARLDADGSGAVERAELVRLIAPGGPGMGAAGAQGFVLRRGQGGGGPGGGGQGGGAPGPAAPTEEAGAAE